MSIELKTHYSAAELALLGLPEFPNTREGVRLLAERESWPRQKRAGRGGGFEYMPPEAIMAQIRERAVGHLLAEAASLPVPKVVQTLPVKRATAAGVNRCAAPA